MRKSRNRKKDKEPVRATQRGTETLLLALRVNENAFTDTCAKIDIFSRAGSKQRTRVLLRFYISFSSVVHLIMIN